ncbi:MAG: hypothetical protein KAJ46_01570 [Sedimentisphaerales bacterium]|nr:hypothetical protein [Sedimentisphaerales bacterium]
MVYQRLRFFFLSACLFVAVVLVGCTGTVTRRPVDDEVVKTTDFTEVDIRSICEKMARSLIDIPQVAKAKSPPTIAFLQMKNRTLQNLDSNNLLGSIRKKLLRYGEGKFTFLNRDIVEKIKRERRMKRSGEVSSSTQTGLYGADYFLSGQAYSEERRNHGIREVYYRFSFQLTNAENSAIVWEDDYEFKKAAKSGTAYR